jgi:hypothetical protein
MTAWRDSGGQRGGVREDSVEGFGRTAWRGSGGQRVEADVDKIESVNAILFVQKKKEYPKK